MNRTDDNMPSGCLGAIFRLFFGWGTPARTEASLNLEALPYRTRDDFLSPAERSFYQVLSNIVGDRATICPKVGLADVFFVARPNENFSYFNRIAQKHVDFLLCDPATMRPLVGIELDDRSHQRADRQERDIFVDKAFEAATLPLVRVPVQSGYSIQEIASYLAPFFSTTVTAGSPPIQLNPDFAPVNPTQTDPGIISANALICPKCGVPMVRRQAGRGMRQGEEFWGCVNFPKCRQTAKI